MRIPMNPAAASPATMSSWRPAMAMLLLIWAVLGLLYAQTVSSMVQIWNVSSTFAHAFLVPPIAAWLVWRQRAVLVQQVPRPQPLILLAVVASTVLWLLSDLVVVNAGAQLAWMALFVLTVPAILGWAVTRVILFPLGFLFFAVPIGEFMTQPMMDWTADFTVAAVRLSGVPVYREGLQFVIPSGRWSVVEACSGVRYLIASVMVGTLFAYLNYRTWQRRVAFIAVAIAVPIVANWVRAYGIVMLGHLSGNTLAVGVDHLIYGWVFFGVVVFIMFAIGARWSEPAEAGLAETSGANGTSGAPAAARSFVATGVALATVLALPHALLWGLQRVESDAAPAALALPEVLPGGWQVVAKPALFKPAFVNPAVEVERSYAGPAGTVTVYLAYYRGQGPQSKLVSSVNLLVSSEDPHWNRVADGQQPSAGGSVAGPSSWRTSRILAQADTTTTAVSRRSQLTAWRAYWVNGHWVAGDVRAKLYGALTRLQIQGDDGAAVVLWTDTDTPEAGRDALAAFTRDALPALDALLSGVRDRR